MPPRANAVKKPNMLKQGSIIVGLGIILGSFHSHAQLANGDPLSAADAEFTVLEAQPHAIGNQGAYFATGRAPLPS